MLAALAVVIPFAPWMMGGRSLVFRDTARLYEPLRGLIGEALRSFRLPLWNPYEGTGKPLFAEGLHAVLHPVSVAMAWLAPSSMDALLLGYFATAAVGTFLLARTLGRSDAAAFLAATGYVLSGFVASMVGNLLFLAGAATLPWVLLGLLFAADRTRTGMVAGALAVAAALLAGDAQIALVGVVLGAALAVERGGPRSLGHVAGVVALGALLGSVQLVPTLVHLQRTSRSIGLTDWERATWALSPWRLVEFASPGLFGSTEGRLRLPVYGVLGGTSSTFIPFADSIHLGIPLLLLAVRGVFGDRTSRVLAVSAAILLWLALGTWAGASQLLHAVPIWGAFRYSEKLLGPLSLCVALLAARGLDRNLDERRFPWIVPVAVLVVAWGGLLVSKGLLAMLLGVAGHAHIAPAAREALLAGYPVALLGTVAFALAAGMPRLREGWRAWSIAGIVLAQAAAALPWAVHPLEPCPGPGWLATLAAAPPGPRIATPNPRDHDAVMPGAWNRTWCELATTGEPAYSAAAGVDQFNAYTGLYPLRFADVFRGLGDERWLLARRFSVTHLITRPAASEEEARSLWKATETAGGKLIAWSSAGAWQAWAVPHRPWASFAPAVSTAGDAPGAMALLLAVLAERKDEVVVETPGPVPVSPGLVRSVKRGRERIEIEAESPGTGLLVVNDAFWPGWRAEVDGREAPILAADVLVRGVPFPAGRHTVVMDYGPPEVAAGIALTAIGVVAMLALLVRRRPVR
jgi:hypothetical protein